MSTKPFVLIILDGWGIAPKGEGNAIARASSPTMHALGKEYPLGELEASGEAVGLPRGEDGNSEVGHLNIGAGRIVVQDFPRINLAIADGSFLKNPALLGAIKQVKRHKSVLHLMGLVGPGSVHSSMEHLIALLWFSKTHGLKGGDVNIHVFTDGRDAAPTSALAYVAQLEEKLKDIGVGQIASVCGRYFAMDRDNHWQRTARAYNALVGHEGETANAAYQAIEGAYQRGLTDEFIAPTMIVDNDGHPKGSVRDHDGMIFFNFRADRARQIAMSFVEPHFETITTHSIISEEGFAVPTEKSVKKKTFKRDRFVKDLFFVTLTQIGRHIHVSAIAFPQVNVLHPLAEVLAVHGKNQLHIAETEKYPHVTYFFNGGRENAFPREDRIVIPSPSVATYDKKPEMSARKITSVLLQRLNAKPYCFTVVNFANADMVGHTGDVTQTMRAVEVVDECVGKIVGDVVFKLGGDVMITADHGNAE
ncbi:MAG: 2,3-bisphosphoglycerate-independent phosphoglycerate mutase, partial [bacterium]|nr:2,3-bisphosphoglycerate-independent phosphoglycerate mutase [bacterium]